jgi:hypothetical protein
MAVAVIQSAGSADFTGTRSTYNFALNAVGADYLLVGFLVRSTSVTVSSVTHGVTGNQVSLTLADSYTVSSDVLYIYKTTTPSQDTSAVVTITLSGAIMGTGGAIALSGVDPTTSLGTAVKSTGSAGSSVYPAGVVSSDTNDVVVDFLACHSNQGAVTPTDPAVGSGQTLRVRADNNHPSVGGAAAGLVASSEPGASSVTMSWGVGSFWTGTWMQWANTVKAAAVGEIAARKHAIMMVL